MNLPVRNLIHGAAMLAMIVPAQAAPALWEVRDNDSAIWLFGSIHILPAGTPWRTELFDTIMANADGVVLETDLGPMAMAEVGAAAFARGIYVDGTLLTDVIDDALEAQLRGRAKSIGMPLGPVLAMRPWLATSAITMAALAAGGFADQGVEFGLQPELPPERLSFLETGHQQLDVLAGASEAEQIAMLQATLDQLDELPELMDQLLASWQNGTPDELGELFLMEMSGFEEAFLERLIYARNRDWIAPIKGMLASNEENLVIVGAAHLTGGDSVLDLLQAAGYSIERIQ